MLNWEGFLEESKSDLSEGTNNLVEWNEERHENQNTWSLD